MKQLMDLLKERMAHLSAALERMEQHEKSIPQIEIDLAMEDLRRMYDALYRLPVENALLPETEATEALPEAEPKVETEAETPIEAAPIVAAAAVMEATTEEVLAQEETKVESTETEVPTQEVSEEEKPVEELTTPEEIVPAEPIVEAQPEPIEPETPAADETTSEATEINADDLFAPPTPEEQAPLPENDLPSLSDIEGADNDVLFEDEPIEEPLAPEAPVSKAEALGQINSAPTLWEKLQQQQSAPSIAESFQAKDEQPSSTTTTEPQQPEIFKEEIDLTIEEKPQVAEPQPEPVPEPVVEQPKETPQPKRAATTGSLFDYFNGPASQANQSANTRLAGSSTPTPTPAPAKVETPVAPVTPQPQTTSAPETPVRTLADTLGKTSQSAIAGNNQQDSISRRQKVMDLRTIININDKFSFMNELFRNNMKAYNDFILRLNSIDNREEAMAAVDEVANQYNWDRNSLSATTFFSILDRKF